MNFNNIRNVDALLDTEYRREKVANHLTDMFAQYLNQAHKAATELDTLNKEFTHYYSTAVPAVLQPEVDRTIEDYLSRQWDKINTTVGGIRKVLDFLQGALENPKYLPVVEEAVAGAGLKSEPSAITEE